jgi:hypothetical protein
MPRLKRYDGLPYFVGVEGTRSPEKRALTGPQSARDQPARRPRTFFGSGKESSAWIIALGRTISFDMLHVVTVRRGQEARPLLDDNVEIVRVLMW